MKKIRSICIVVGIIILILCGVILAKDVYYTINIKSEINLSEEEKKEVNKKELISDIKAYIYRGSFKYAEPQRYKYEGPSPTIPVYGGTCYGKGYTANENSGEFRTSAEKINPRVLYEAEYNPNGTLFLLIAALLIIEVIFTSIYIFGKRGQKRREEKL